MLKKILFAVSFGFSCGGNAAALGDMAYDPRLAGSAVYSDPGFQDFIETSYGYLNPLNKPPYTVNFRDAVASPAVPAPAPPARSHNGHIHLTRDCASLKLGPGEGPVESKKAELTSQRYIEECKPVAAGDSGLIIEHCYNRPLEEWTRTVKLLAKPRQVPHGKKEIFEVCLEGEKLELALVSVFNAYAVAKEGETEVLFTLTPSEEPVPAEKKAP
ncbi:MAG: hypothetical protein Q7R35_20180 [Elusimicrobiota bacterium]|nr:hypothetical protein [Elusimicrobiota bacterium]